MLLIFTTFYDSYKQYVSNYANAYAHHPKKQFACLQPKKLYSSIPGILVMTIFIT